MKSSVEDWLKLGRGARRGLHGDLSQHARRRRLPTQVVVDTDVDIVAAVKSAISRGEAMTTKRGEGAETLLERAIEPIVSVDGERLFLLTQVCHTTAYFPLPIFLQNPQKNGLLCGFPPLSDPAKSKAKLKPSSTLVTWDPDSSLLTLPLLQQHFCTSHQPRTNYGGKNFLCGAPEQDLGINEIDLASHGFTAKIYKYRSAHALLQPAALRRPSAPRASPLWCRASRPNKSTGCCCTQGALQDLLRSTQDPLEVDRITFPTLSQLCHNAGAAASQDTDLPAPPRSLHRACPLTET